MQPLFSGFTLNFHSPLLFSRKYWLTSNFIRVNKDFQSYNNKLRIIWLICSQCIPPLPLKISENLTIFCFHGVEKGCIGNKQVKGKLETLSDLYKQDLGKVKTSQIPCDWILNHTLPENKMRKLYSSYIILSVIFVQFVADSWREKVYVVITLP